MKPTLRYLCFTKLFIYLTIIMMQSCTTDTYSFNPRSDMRQIKQNNLDHQVAAKSARYIKYITVTVKAFLKHLLLSLKLTLKRLRSMYHSMKPEVAVGTCFTNYINSHYFNENPFGPLGRRRRDASTPDVAAHLADIAASMADIQDSLLAIMANIQSNASSKHDAVEMSTAVSVQSDPAKRISSKSDVFLANGPTGIFVSIFGITPQEMIDTFVPHSVKFLWKTFKWVKWVIGKIISHKLSKCSSEYVGTRFGYWMDNVS